MKSMLVRELPAPPAPAVLKIKEEVPFRPHRGRPISCRVMLPFVRVCFPLFSGIPEIAASPCDMDATQAHSAKVTWRAARSVDFCRKRSGRAQHTSTRPPLEATLGNTNPASVSGPFLLSADLCAHQYQRTQTPARQTAQRLVA